MPNVGAFEIATYNSGSKPPNVGGFKIATYNNVTIDLSTINYIFENHVTEDTKHKLFYILTPESFKLCLMRSKNTLKYANYYILLEKIMFYFSNYENEYKEILLSGKDTKIDTLINDNKELLGETKELKSMISKQSDSLKSRVSSLV